VVVPDHHLVGRVARVVAAANEGEDVAPEQHLHDPDPAVQKVYTDAQCATRAGGACDVERRATNTRIKRDGGATGTLLPDMHAHSPR
jgi:hypothetical protein